MQINLTTNMLTATPIRPLFKGNSEEMKCSKCANCPICNSDTEIKPETRKIDNKGLAKDKFEQSQTEKQKSALAALIMVITE